MEGREMTKIEIDNLEKIVGSCIKCVKLGRCDTASVMTPDEMRDSSCAEWKRKSNRCKKSGEGEINTNCAYWHNHLCYCTRLSVDYYATGDCSYYEKKKGEKQTCLDT
jgi:hypothetical protein